jgi:DNA transposition AAA+ family ATPase
MPEHFLGLSDVAILDTSQYQLTSKIISDLVKLRGMGAIHGPAGTGKTFAVTCELENQAATTSLVTCMTTAHEQPTMRNTLESIAIALTGHKPPKSQDRFDLTARLIELLAGPERLIVVDEAQRLNGKCIEVLRHLHDAKRTRFSLLLVGGDGCWEVLSREPMLKSRIVRRLPFHPLSPEAISTLIGGYHPIYCDVAPEVLLEIDQHYGEGNLRNWAAFTLTAAQLCAATSRERIDDAIIANAYTLLGGGKND